MIKHFTVDHVYYPDKIQTKEEKKYINLYNSVQEIRISVNKSNWQVLVDCEEKNDTIQ